MYNEFSELPDVIRGMYKEFSKRELIDIADELGLGVKGRGIPISTRQILVIITNDLEEEGIPDIDTVSDELYEFMLTGNFIDEDGNIVDAVLGGVDTEEQEEVTDESEPMEYKVPECFSFAEPRDPACGKCKLYDACYQERIATRPSCFGKLFDVNAEECRNCLEFDDCRVASNK